MLVRKGDKGDGIWFCGKRKIKKKGEEFEFGFWCG